MASQQDIKRRIASVRNTRKITKAMELVAGARLRRAQARIEALRDYADGMLELMVGAARRADARANPLLVRRGGGDGGDGGGPPTGAVLLVTITGDRGLAGAFNSQIVRHALTVAARHRREGREVKWLVVGRRGTSTLRFRGYTAEESFTGFTDRPAYTDAEAVAHTAAELFENETVDEVVVIYNSFKSAIEQRVTDQRLLPIDARILERVQVADRDQRGGAPDDDGGDKPAPEPAAEGREADVLYEPEPEAILAALVPTYLETTLYRALLESAASEHGARMTAMRSASDNAQDVMEDLTLAMNRARQAEITQEISEVVAGAEALT